MGKFWAYFIYRLRIFWRDPTTLCHALFFFALIFIVAGFLQLPGVSNILVDVREVYHRASLLFLLFLSLFTVFLATENVWKSLYEQGVLAHLALSPLSFLEVALAEYLVGLVSIIIPLLLLNTLIICGLENVMSGFSAGYIIGVSFLLICVWSFILLLQAVVLMAKRSSKFIVMLLLLPLCTPVLVLTFSVIFEGEPVFVFLVGLFFILWPCSLAATAWVLKQAFK